MNAIYALDERPGIFLRLGVIPSLSLLGEKGLSGILVKIKSPDNPFFIQDSLQLET